MPDSTQPDSGSAAATSAPVGGFFNPAYQDDAAQAAASAPGPASPAAPAAAAPPSVAQLAAGTAPPPTTTDPGVTDRIPGQPAPPEKNFFQKTYDGVMTALGGANTVSFTRDGNTGKITVHNTPKTLKTPGQQWKSIIAGALAGLGNTASQPNTGPGAGMRGLALGVQGGMGAAQQEQDRARQNANEDAEAEQKAAYAKAQTAHLAQQTAKMAWEMSWNKVQALQGQAQQEFDWNARMVDAGEGSRDAGIYPTFQDYVKTAAADPTHYGMQAGGQAFPLPHINEKGEIDGVHVYQFAQNWLDQKTDKDDAYRELVPGEKVGDPPYWKQHVVPAGSQTRRAFYTAQLQQNAFGLKALNDWQETQNKTTEAGARVSEAASKAAVVPSEEAKNYGSANRDNADALKLKADAELAGNAAGGGGLIDQIGQGKLEPGRLAYLLAKKPELMEAVVKKYPDFDSSKINAYAATYKDFTSGPTSKALNSGGTVLNHLAELKALNTPMSHIPHTPAWTAYQNKADTVAAELGRFYNTTTIPAIAAIKDTLTSTIYGNRDAAITTQAQSMGDKFDSFEQTWENAAPSKAYKPAMPGISEKAKDARASLDPAYAQRHVAELQDRAKAGGAATPGAGGAGGGGGQQQPPTPPAKVPGKVNVWIPGETTWGQIPASGVQAFQQTHPNGVVQP